MNVGIDLWNTLIEPSDEFKEAKLSLMKYYDLMELDVIMPEIKSNLNKIIEVSGFSPNKKFLVNYMYNSLKLSEKLVDKGKIHEFLLDYNKLATIYTPNLLPGVEEGFMELKNRVTNLNLLLVSNTMFIGGEELTKILKRLDICHYFNYLYFSDNEGVSKPEVGICRDKLDIFIGDNELTDGSFASEVGAVFIQVTPERSFKDAVITIINGPY
jgi:FMN phosphatase YigB (HAD superfamily)